jgi:hypothetical protein
MKIIATVLLLFFFNTAVYSQSKTFQKPQKTQEQQILELNNPAWKVIHDAEMEQQWAFYTFMEQNGAILGKQLSGQISSEEADTSHFTASARSIQSYPEWHVHQLETTINYFSHPDSTYILRRMMTNNPAEDEWTLTQQVDQVGFRDRCEPMCSSYTLKRYNSDGSIQYGYQTLEFEDYLESTNWDNTQQRFIPSGRSITIYNDNDDVIESNYRQYYTSTQTFGPGNWYQYEYDDRGIRVRDTNIQFDQDSTITRATRNSLTINYELMDIIEQYTEVIPRGTAPENAEWQPGRRIRNNYGDGQIEQTDEIWLADENRWRYNYRGTSFYTNIGYADTAYTHIYNQSRDELVPAAALKNIYDGDYKLLEQRTYLYNLNEERYFWSGRLLNTYNDSGKLVSDIMYGSAGGDLFKTRERYFTYNSDGNQIDLVTWNFNVNGDVASGTRQVSFYQNNIYFGYANYSWDTSTEEWYETGFYYNNATAAELSSQTRQRMRNWDGSINDVINANNYNDTPIVFNFGPVEISDGDLIEFPILGIDTDMNKPEITILNLPQGATFDEETHEFSWQIGTAQPTEMTVRGVSPKGTYETVVSFIPRGTVTSIDENQIPGTIALFQNYPNPFNPSTTVGFELSQPGNVTMELYDMLGRRIAILLNEWRPSGSHQIRVDGSTLASGIYLYRVSTGEVTLTRTMTLVK